MRLPLSKQEEKPKNYSWFSLILAEYNVSYLGYFAVMATLSLYFVNGLRLPAALAGMLMLFTSLSFRFSRIFLAPLVDRFPVHRTIFFSLLVASLGYLGLAFTAELIFVVPLFFLIGVGHGINSMLVKTVTAHSPRTANEKSSPFLRYAYLAAGINLMTAVGSVLGSTLILRVSFSSVFFLASLFYGVAAGITAFLPDLPTEATQRPVWREAFQLSLKLTPLRRAMISTFLGWFLYTQYYASLPLFVNIGLHRPELLFSIFALNACLIVAQLPLSRLLMHFHLPISQAIVLAFLSFAGGYGLLWLFPSWQMVYVAVILWTLGEMLLIPALDTQIAEGALSYQRQVAFTLNSMIIGLGEGLGNLAGVGLASWFLGIGAMQLFYFLLFALALGAIGVLILIGNPRESLLIRKFHGLSFIPTGQTTTLPVLFPALPEGGPMRTILNWLSESSFHTGDERYYLEADIELESPAEENPMLYVPFRADLLEDQEEASKDVFDPEATIIARPAKLREPEIKREH